MRWSATVQLGGDTRAVVTGAGSGLGRALAKALAARGVTVVVSDVREDAARKTASEIAAAGGVCHVVACDVTRADDVARLAAESPRLLLAAVIPLPTHGDDVSMATRPPTVRRVRA